MPAAPTYDPASLLANATKAIEVLEILIDIAKADTGGGGGGVNAVTVPGVGSGVGDSGALVRTLLGAFLPLFGGFVDGG